jgi:hypothetical protein
MWPERHATAVNVGWVQSITETLAADVSRCFCVNYLGQSGDEGVGRVKAAYGPSAYARLVALTEKYDPKKSLSCESKRPAEGEG